MLTVDALREPEAKYASSPGRPVDVKSLFNAFARRWKLFVTVVIGVLIVAVTASLVMKPAYDATATIRIDPNQKQAVDLQALASGAPPDQALVDSEVKVMQSRDLARAVVDELGLAKDPEFVPAGGLRAMLFGGARPPAEEVATDNLLRRLDVSRQGTTYLVGLRARSDNPAKAANIANAFAREYMIASVRTRVQTAAEQSDWLSKRLDAAGAEAQRADAQLAQYKADKGLVSASGGGTMTEQQISTLTLQLATAESEAAAARSNYQAARNQMTAGGLDSVSSVLNSNTITELRRQRADLQRNQAEINARYGPRHPEAVKVEQQVIGLDKQLRDEAQRILGGLESDARAAEARAASLRHDVGVLNGQLATNTQASVGADSLQREAEAKRTIFSQLAASAQQVNQQEHSSTAQARILALASVATKPYFPNTGLFGALGLALGLILGVAAVFIAELVDGGVRTVEDVEHDLRVNFIASAPLLTAKVLQSEGRKIAPWDYVVARPMSGFAESMRSARSAIKFAEIDNKRKVVAVTSALPSEGKTVSSVSLARVMAMSGERVILVDCDLRRNALEGLLKEAPTVGLVEVLTGAVTLEQAIVKDTVSGLDVLPLHKAAFTPRDLFGTKAMSDLLDVLRQRYDHVVLDCPPLLAVNDARVLASLADAVLFVARWSKTPRRAIQTALGHLTNDRSRVAGVLLSMVDTRARLAIGTGDPTYYYGHYRGYYHD